MKEPNNDLIKAFADIDAYIYKYKNSAQQLTQGDKGVDDDVHVGIMAQDLQENPITKDSVSESEYGFLQVDTRQLVLTLAALVSNLSKKVLELEKKIEDK